MFKSVIKICEYWIINLKTFTIRIDPSVFATNKKPEVKFEKCEILKNVVSNS